MTLRKCLKVVCPTACAVCLAAGYVLAGKAAGAAPVALVWLAWLFAARWPTSLMLAASVGLAAAGLCVGASPHLMLPGATLALASWDIARWDSFIASGLSIDIESRLEQKHYTSLALALVPGLLAAMAGQLIHLQIPFGVVVIVALLALLGIDRIWHLARV
jgi:hypothetical protein